MASHNGSETSVLISKDAWFIIGFLKTAGFWNFSLLEETGCPPPPGGELLRATHQSNFSYQPLRTTSIAWGTAADVAAGRDQMTREAATQWQAFDSTDGKGVWWWNENDEDWFLESEPGSWIQFTDSNNGQPHWCHPDGRSFCASLEDETEQ